VEHREPRRGVRGGAVTGANATHNEVFGADPAHVRWLGERIVGALRDASPRRGLDIGCGDGSLILHLAEVMPQTSFLGIDLSQGNIAAANAAIARSPNRERLAVAQGDYLRLDVGAFDLIVASSSLQGIETSSEQLAAKIARDLAAGGSLIHVTPYRCLYNTTLNSVRIALRSVRGTATDRMILTVARLLHPGQSLQRLRERVDYMYLVLRHSEDSLRAALTRHGLQLIAAESAPHTSLGQPKHRLAVMRAPAAANQ
jgi:trans-aconitate 2-methyltransferase